MSWLSWQIDYLLLLQNFRELTYHVFDKFFLTVTMLGEVHIPLMLICALYWCINKKYGIYLFWSYLFGFIGNTFLKTTACIYRPWILDSRIKPLADAITTATGYSFPSGHTASCTTTWGGTAILFWNNKIIRYLCFIIIFLVIFSRNYLGVHTPQDVLVSLAIGILIILFNKKLLDWEEKNQIEI
ncbi:MAG: phosphatase PAP2 family protein [Candidatus Gastranaerophilales bacterium]|nr:phosphatase PAP2 family protein [Candidatus Gastranaerophilales bacterium]